MRRIHFVVVALMLMLGACNRVVTDQPLFVASDAPDAPKLREGVWIFSQNLDENDKPCRVDTRKPATKWPKCVEWALVRNGEMLAKADKGDSEWRSGPYVLAAGPLPALQFPSDDEGKQTYEYYSLDVTRRADDGRIEAFGLRPVLCGPPPPADAKNPDGSTRYATLEPLRGMTIVGDNCTTDSPAAVVAAAAASRDWQPVFIEPRWVRDTYP